MILKQVLKIKLKIFLELATPFVCEVSSHDFHFGIVELSESAYT